jgi:hypothetical protein
MRFKTKFFILSAACLSLTMFGAGCDNSSVNESKPAGSATANVAPPKDAPPPPKDYKEYYERSQRTATTGNGAAPAKPKDKSNK